MSNQRHPDKTFSKSKIFPINPLAEYETYEPEWARMSDVEGRDQAWFWKNVIPLQTSTVLAGIGGIGKSLVLLSIISSTTTGEEVNICGEKVIFPKGSVILLSAEDDLRSQIQPKLKSANADLNKIHFIKSKVGSQSKKKRFLELDNDLHIIEDKILKLKEEDEIVTFIVIDPIAYFLGNVRDNYNQEVANFLQGINDLAEKHNLAIILNKHLRKQSSGAKGIIDAINEISGAGAWINTPRMCWLITSWHDDHKIKIITNAKQNLLNEDEIQLAYAYKIVSHEGRGKMEWLDHKIKINSKEAMNEETYQKGKLDAAIDYILDYLRKFGQSRFTAIQEAALKDGIKEKTFRNASEKFEQDYTSILKIDRGYRNAKTYQLLETL